MIREHSNNDVASLTDHAYQAIASAIFSMELKPGETLTQDRLARWLSISRTPVREALRRLEQDGIIQQRHGHGLVVAELTLKDVEEMQELLLLLAPYAAELAAQRRSLAQAQQLKQIAKQLEQCAQDNKHSCWIQYNQEFQTVLLDAANNSQIAGKIHDVHRRLQRIANSTCNHEWLSIAAQQQVQLSIAIEQQHSAQAAEIMRQHTVLIGEQIFTLIHNYLIPIRGARF
jgi:DNA-binding GntR family transcriptional regulator